MEFMSEMNEVYIKAVLLVFLLLVFGCKDSSHSDAEDELHKNVAAANEFIDAFYSFNSDELESTLAYAEESKPSIMYYQGWAEGGNYEIIERHPCVARNDSMVICPVTVKDDLIGALEIDFNVTDTFHVKVGADLFGRHIARVLSKGALSLHGIRGQFTLKDDLRGCWDLQIDAFTLDQLYGLTRQAATHGQLIHLIGEFNGCTITDDRDRADHDGGFQRFSHLPAFLPARA